MSATGDFGPAPAGVDLRENQQVQMLGAVISLMVIGTLAVILRIYTRAKSSQTNFGLDDYLIFASLCFAYGTAICVIISTNYKNGWHQQTLTDSEFVSLWKLLFAHVFLYSTTVTLTKSSIIMFYRRIFNLRWSLYFAMSIILGYFVAVIATISVACRPLSHFWLQYTDPSAEGTCISTSDFFLINGIISVLIDVMILCVPAPIIWRLQMPRTQRLAVISILLLGGFVCVAGIIRVVFLDKNTHSMDPSWTIAPVFVWSCVEPFIGIICACLPTFSPLFRRWWAIMGVKRSGSKKKQDYYGTGGSRINRSRHQTIDDNDQDDHHDNHGDEVQLTSFPGWPLHFLRGKDSSDHMASNSNIQVKEEIVISWN
ncbi:hypothetical protein N7541_011745 [Penicillium brevicompactum]|uniref:Rhodopsin domain-containing protein n=1 Tax=Penicillium brevicompactum TaxID=5074 RepID=A0A9W9UL64_PENBR|nr:hypothetical protein N7541_011745 [Penicillium brevicompactum]